MSYSSRSPDIPAKVIVVFIGAVLFVLGILTLIFSPWLHGLAMLVYVCWPFFALLTLGIVSYVFVPYPLNIPVTTAIGIVMLVFMMIAGPLHDLKFLDNQSKERVYELQDTTAVRYMPYEVASTIGPQKASDSTVELGDFQPVIEGEDVNWSAPRTPNGFNNTYFGNQQGAAFVRSDASVEVDNTTFTYGEGMGITDSIDWVLHKENYFTTKEDKYYINVDGELLMLVPYVEWSFDFPVMVEEWGGVFVVHTDGTIEDLSPEEASSDPRFTNERLYPEELAKQTANLWQYDHGYWNTVGLVGKHYDQAINPTISSSNNQPPYLIPTEDGPKWFVALEPYGKSYAMHTALYVDAHTGEVDYYRAVDDYDGTAVSPNATPGFVQSALPNYQWVSGESGKIKAFEPRPVVLGGEIYWMVSIANTAYTNITATAMVNGDGSKVTELKSYDEVMEFIDNPGSVGKTNTPTGSEAEGQTGSQEPSTKGSDSSQSSSRSKEEIISDIEKDLEELKSK